MAHEIATSKVNGKASIAFAGEVPWHGLGQRVEDAMTALEAMSLGQLGYTVEKWPISATAPDGQQIPIPDQWMTVRTDTRERLGIVSDKYKVFQNSECFDFLDSVVASGDLRYETVGALGVGERVWMLARVPGDIRINQTDDITKKYLLLSNGHDGITAIRCLFTGIRVVCANTQRMALANAADGITLKHTGDLQAKVTEAQKALGLATTYFDGFQEAANHLASVQVNRSQLDTYFRALYPDAEDAKETKGAKVLQSNATTRMTLFGLFEQGMGQDLKGVKGTAYAAYNAVTEYIDHHTGKDKNWNQRQLESAWWGDGSRIKARAFDLAVSLADGKLGAKSGRVSLN